MFATYKVGIIVESNREPISIPGTLDLESATVYPHILECHSGSIGAFGTEYTEGNFWGIQLEAP